MAIEDVANEYFTYENRLASFQTAQQLSKRRTSTANSKAPKSLRWPHKFLSAEQLAKAGFFYYPLQVNPDNVACFLCHKHLDGWEEDDDPLAEHLKHSPDCGWAVTAAIEKGDKDLLEEYPASARLMEARRATFGDKWPHENKKGWKCKVKQMVDAGWRYTPTPEFDDMATCTYCSLALDGWEPGDKPLDEHFKRSPECPFFTLINKHNKSPAPKRTKSKRERTSKVSRLSIQSTFTVASEAPSISDLPAEDDDSILTTATTATTASTKKMGKGKKAVGGKGRKTRAKKTEPIEIEAPEPEDDDFEVKIDLAPKPVRGKKRKSDEEESATPGNEIEVPQPKRRATRTRGSTAIDESILTNADEQSQGTLKPAPKKGRQSRKVSAVSVASPKVPVLNDDDLDKQLLQDLDRPLTDDETETVKKITKKSTRTSNLTALNHSMFGINGMEIDEAAIDAELEAMEVDSKPLPKAKAAKGKQPRKVSAKQKAAAKKAAEEEAEAQRIAEEEALQHVVAEIETIDDTRDDSGNDTDASMASQSTVVRGGSTRRSSTLKKGKGGKKAASKNIEEIVYKAPEPISAANGNSLTVNGEDISMMEERFYTPAPEAPPQIEEPAPIIIKANTAKPRGRQAKQESVKETKAVEPKGKAKARAAPEQPPTPPPKALTPAQSPQSSDAENHPPSSKPSGAMKRTITPQSVSNRIPLSAKTPTMSPSKRNVVAGLQSNNPWTAVDLDAIFLKSPNRENGPLGLGEAMEKLKNGDLSSPEKKMTVEEWIHHNAELAEERLKNECERMVGAFEREGTRAMRALEGIECIE